MQFYLQKIVFIAIEFEVIRSVGNERFLAADKKALLSLGPIAFFSD